MSTEGEGEMCDLAEIQLNVAFMSVALCIVCFTPLTQFNIIIIMHVSGLLFSLLSWTNWAGQVGFSWWWGSRAPITHIKVVRNLCTKPCSVHFELMYCYGHTESTLFCPVLRRRCRRRCCCRRCCRQFCDRRRCAVRIVRSNEQWLLAWTQFAYFKNANRWDVDGLFWLCSKSGAWV